MDKLQRYSVDVHDFLDTHRVTVVATLTTGNPRNSAREAQSFEQIVFHFIVP
ncbi:hypothetical protein DPMN_010492 [Dreissena polymorpha]|uniref:Uncharacterized protein n=1 Tax=Dreissena polymorpha TaxID=45954 RepID=A0A9D4N4B2_DREPO|nr:hypothetical protein DPMN_010492 [Dreissena polymorpha]